MWNATEEKLKKLYAYKPNITNKPVDFASFWDRKKEKVSEPEVKVNWTNFPVSTVEVGELELISWDGTPLKGYIVKPKAIKSGPILTVFHGLRGNRGFPTDFLKWTTLGLTVISFDVRSQGDSPDYATYSNGSRVQGVVLRGILDPEEYYYTNIYQDVMAQLKWITAQTIVKPTKIGVIGSSQGGTLALAAAGLMKEVVDFALVDCPFMTYVETAITKATAGSYTHIQDYFKLNDPQMEQAEQIAQTLAYVDTIHFAEEITCPVLMSTGLLDTTTPAITAFALLNSLKTTDKHMDAYPRYAHEIVPFHEIKKFEFIQKQL